MHMNDPEIVRAEYADESRFAVRAAAWSSSTGPNPRELAFSAVAEIAPRRVLEVGSGRGELTERIASELEADVVAVDQSERMVELTRARGVSALGTRRAHAATPARSRRRDGGSNRRPRDS